MRASTYSSYSDDLSTLTVSELPSPKLAPSAVLIEVRAAGVNPVDWKLMAAGLEGCWTRSSRSSRAGTWLAWSPRSARTSPSAPWAMR